MAFDRIPIGKFSINKFKGISVIRDTMNLEILQWIEILPRVPCIHVSM